jgi:predicted metal-dependent hydrolase
MEIYKDIEYEVVRRKRKTISLIVQKDGHVTIQVPESLKEHEIQDIIEKKRTWIYRQIAEFEDLNESRVKRDFVSGQGFLYLGYSYRLEVTEETDKDIKLYRGKFYLKKSKLTKAKEIFKNFYREKGLEKIAARVELYKKKVGVNPIDVRVMELKNRWASCSDEGRLNFHWKCCMAPLSIIDYIVVHELVHLKHKDHSKEFWNEVDKVIPDYEKRVKWLQERAPSLDI